MGSIRGISFIPVVKYIKETYGDDAIEKVMEKLSDEQQKIFSEKFELMHWYPGKALVDFISVSDKLFGQGDHKVAYMLGRYGAEDTFKGLYKMFLEFGKPHTIIRRAPMAWRLLNSSGDLEVETLGENSTKVKIVGFEDHTKAHCWNLIGYFQKVLELSGANNVDMKEVKCVSSGDDYCEFEARWE